MEELVLDTQAMHTYMDVSTSKRSHILFAFYSFFQALQFS